MRRLTVDDLEKRLRLSTSLVKMEAHYQEIGTHIRYAKNRIIQLDNEATSLDEKTNMLKKELVKTGAFKFPTGY